VVVCSPKLMNSVRTTSRSLGVLLRCRSQSSCSLVVPGALYPPVSWAPQPSHYCGESFGIVGQPFLQQVHPICRQRTLRLGGHRMPSPEGGDGIWALYPEAESKLFEQGSWQV
jgi:hypothetical protein